MVFHFEHDDDRECRPGPIAEDKREDIFAHMIAGILAIYRYFVSEQMQEVQQPIQRQQPKIGRNNPCFLIDEISCYSSYQCKMVTQVD
jgi:hypothetical protein